MCAEAVEPHASSPSAHDCFPAVCGSRLLPSSPVPPAGEVLAGAAGGVGKEGPRGAGGRGGPGMAPVRSAQTPARGESESPAETQSLPLSPQQPSRDTHGRRKSDLRDRTGRKQTLPPMSELDNGWPHREDSPMSRRPGPPANWDSDSDHLPGREAEDPSSGADPAVLSSGPQRLDAIHAPGWPELQTLLRQLPPQDSHERYCLALAEEERAELQLFCAQRKQEALGQGVARPVSPWLEGHTCEKCRQPLKPGEYGVFAARAGEQHCWHRSCFTCQACGQTLVSLIYFYRDGHLYCGRHHAELLRPRCPACDQLIFSPRCTEAEGRRWHENHFCCQDCAGPLGGGRYALPGGSPCCPSCFESRYSDACSSSAGALEGRATLGEEGPKRTERKDRSSMNTNSAALLAAAASSSLETQQGQECRAGAEAEGPRKREQGHLETPPDPREDVPCSTCSSSSDSEPEGFFLGQPLPRSRKTPGSPQAGDRATSRKHCTIC
ncbi:prickle-like protein 4 isoform X2 [Lepus europaeus]|uniref:prickle-like protein 4 isoform X2 n=1 Tax=Lepus europaeus TaxID=9983 RepID=UPI002B49ECD2|nr:prickle-like protein 4 isoform X2 [Lepus europaeus]